MRVITTLLLALGLAVSALAAPIPLHVSTEVEFEVSLGTKMGYYDTQVPDGESLTMACGSPTAPVAMVAGCLVGNKVACQTKASMMPFTTVHGQAADVRLTLEAEGVAVDGSGIVVDQRVVCNVQRTRLADGARAAVPINASAGGPVGMTLVPGIASLKLAGTDKVTVAAKAKDFSGTAVASAPAIGPFALKSVIEVRSVDTSGNSCSPLSSLPFMVLEDVSSQEGTLSCEPIEGETDCGSVRCLLPATATRLTTTLRPSDSSKFSSDVLYAQVLVTPTGSP